MVGSLAVHRGLGYCKPHTRYYL